MPHRLRGYSLLELIITLSLIFILAMAAVPAFQGLSQRHRNQALLHQLHTSLQSARADAVIRRRPLELCANNTQKGCGSDWASGWLIISPTEHQVLSINQPPHNLPLRWSGFGQRIRFLSDGSSPASNGRFYLCHKGELAWQLILSRQGRARVATEQENLDDVTRCQAP
ncbi:Type II transport protein GspH [compost metagenome]